MRNLPLLFVLLVFLLIALFACAPAATPAPTVDVPAIETSAAASVLATVTASAPTPIPCNATDDASKINGAYVAFKDIDQRAAVTARIALTSVVGEMQRARQDLAAANISNCDSDVTAARTAVLDWMQSDIDAYLAFMQYTDNGNPLVVGKINAAQQKGTNASGKVSAMQAKFHSN